MKPFVKICGITNFADAKVAIDSGVDALGFIAFSRSPRHLEPADFKTLAAEIKNYSPKTDLVVVMVNPDQAYVDSYCQAGADVIQFHGQETPEFVNRQTCRAWKAKALKSVDDIAPLNQYDVEFLLIDSFVKDATVPGGNGVLADWELSRQAVEQLKQPLLLAGGINPDNVVDAWQEVHPAGFDLSSGVEVSPGIKDHDKIKQLFQNLANCN